MEHLDARGLKLSHQPTRCMDVQVELRMLTNTSIVSGTIPSMLATLVPALSEQSACGSIFVLLGGSRDPAMESRTRGRALRATSRP